MICKYVNNERWIVNCNYYDWGRAIRVNVRNCLLMFIMALVTMPVMIIINATKNYEEIIKGFEH